MRVWVCCLLVTAFLTVTCSWKDPPPPKTKRNPLRSIIAVVGCSAAVLTGGPDLFPSNAATISSAPSTEVSAPSTEFEVDFASQSPRWEKERQKRTTAIKALEKEGFVRVTTDDLGNQFLNLPWIPNQKVPYKSLSVQQRLLNEVCAGCVLFFPFLSILYTLYPCPLPA